MKAEIVAHLEYFYNTLNIEHKIKIENPFDNPNDYPALNHKIGDKIGSDVIMESGESSSEDENTGTGRPVISDNDLIDHS